MPASYHIAQELQKYNMPDYRPRQEQYVHVLYIYAIVNGGFQVPKSDQEGSSSAKNATKSWVCVFADGEWSSRSDKADKSIRYFQV